MVPCGKGEMPCCSCAPNPTQPSPGEARWALGAHGQPQWHGCWQGPPPASLAEVPRVTLGVRKWGDAHLRHPYDGHLFLLRLSISLHKCAEAANFLLSLSLHWLCKSMGFRRNRQEAGFIWLS